MIRRTLLAARAIAIVVILASWGALSAEAASSPVRLGLTPVGQPGPYFELTMSPGQVRRLEVAVGNFGGDSVVARTYAADVYSLVNGGFGAQVTDSAPTGTTTWLDFPTQEVRLTAGASVAVDFQVAVPPGTQSGQYLTSLVVESTQPSPGDAGSVTVNQVNRVAIAVAIDVPGPRHPGLLIGGVTHKMAGDTSFLSFAVDNPGNVHLKPAGELTLRESNQIEIARETVTMDSVYAGSNTHLEVHLAAPLRPGGYCAELSLTDPTTGASARTTCLSFDVAPAKSVQAGRGASSGIPVVQSVLDTAADHPLIVLIGLGAALMILTLLLAIGRRRRWGREGRGPAGRRG